MVKKAKKNIPDNKQVKKEKLNKFIKDALTILFLLVVIFWISFFFSSMDIGKVKDFILKFGVFAPLAIILVLAFAVILAPVPSFPIDIMAGSLYGWFWGGVISLIGAVLGAFIAFIIARKFGRIFLKKYFKNGLSMFDRSYGDSLPWAIFVLRLVPLLHLDVISYAAGLTKIKKRMFLLATTLGMIPMTFLLTYYGERIPAGNAWITLIFSLLVVLAIYFIPRYFKEHPEKMSMTNIENYRKNVKKEGDKVKDRIIKVKDRFTRRKKKNTNPKIESLAKNNEKTILPPKT